VLITLTVNGMEQQVEAEPAESLLTLLRERLGLTGSKNACEQGECGACSVWLDGDVVCACLVPALQAEGARVVTIEALHHRVQQAFLEAGAVQCGYCTPGLLIAAADLLERDPHPTDEAIEEALAGNLCRCTGYRKVLAAVRLAEVTA